VLEADKSPPSSAEANTALGYTSNPPYVFISWHRIKHRGNVIFTVSVLKTFQVNAEDLQKTYMPISLEIHIRSTNNLRIRITEQECQLLNNDISDSDTPSYSLYCGRSAV
jgi:hypothetical protein